MITERNDLHASECDGNVVVVPAMPLDTYRFERKYKISAVRARALAQQLKHVMKHDPYADETGHYCVRSVYFDSQYNSAVYEKLDGVSVRSKFRVRLYNGNTGRITLEKKRRIHNMCNKQNLGITENQCRMLLRGEYDWMSESLHPLITELRNNLKCGFKPKCLVEYDRQVFVHPNGNVRVTIDKSIRTSNCFNAFFDEKTYSTGIPVDSYAVLEIKYDHFLPYHLQLILQTADVVQESISKYVQARAYNRV